jgi:DNA mismatch repair protein MutS2
LKAKAEAIARAPRLVSTGDTGAARGDARAAVDAIAARLLAGEGSPAESTIESAIRSPQSAMTTVAVGSRVIVGGLGLEAIVTSVHDGTADLDVRGKRMRASIRDLRLVGGQAPAARVSVNVELQPRETTASDLNVIGCTVDEALTRTERFLDESLLTDQRVIRLIHGYGTGQLKRALAGFLQQHPLVARFATAPPNQGGGGVTVVELKD